MSNWDYVDEVDIIPRLPPNFDELRESKKWQDRKEALEELLKVLTNNERLSTKVSYAELIGNLQTMLAKDANINCQALAARCIAKFATGLRLKFSQFSAPLLPVIFERMKEKKPALREPLVECAMEVGRTMTSLEAGQDDVLAAMAKPNPQIKQQTALFVAKQLDLVAPAKQPKGFIKAVTPVLGKLTSDADQDVREAALQALGAIQRIIGDKNIKSLLGDVASDDTKIKKIREFSEKSAAKFAEEQAKTAPPAPEPTATSSATPSTTKAATKPVEPVEEADPWDFLDEFDLLSKMPDAFDTMIQSKKWQERKEALEDLSQLLTAHPKLDPKGSYGSLVEQLQKVLEKDANILVAALAANCLAGLANGLRSKFQQFAVSVAPIIFEKFKEKKPMLRDPLVKCIDAVVATTSLEAIGEIVLVALSKPNPSIKTQTDLFLQRAFMGLNSQTMPKKTLKTLIPSLVKHSGDSDSEVREASYAAMGAMMRAIGEKPSLQLLADIVSDSMRMGKIREYHQKALAEAGPAESVVQPIQKADAPPPVSAPPKKQAPPKRQEPEEEEKENEEEPLKQPVFEKKKKTAATKENAENEPPVAPKSEILLNDNGEKAQRIKEEKQLKLVKWNFQSPTEDHISQLQTLLGNQAKVSLMSQLFHKDFKQQLAALDTLIRLSDTSPRSLLANSDLLLKWCTLRFFETNPAALIKVLELCKVLVELTKETETPVSNEELTSFVPYLLLKTGEPKENMRTAVRDIINTLTDIVGPLKMTPMLLDALKSKNARQRSECLLVIESYILRTGIGPLKSLTVERIVAPLVGDKDTNVRNAAINVLVACFKFEGDQMWKAAGKMSDKDRSLVEERIKRSGVKGGSGVPNGGPKIVVPQQQPIVRRPASRCGIRQQEEEDVDEEAHRTIMNTTFEKPSTAARSRYALRDDVASSAIETLKNAFNVVSTPQPPVAASSSWANSTMPTFQLKRTNSASSLSSIDTSDNIQRSINNISSGLQDIAQDAMYQVTYVLNQPDQRHLVDRRADLVFRASAAQLDMVIEDFTAGKDVTATMEACTQMLFILMSGVDTHLLEPLNASPETVKAIITAVLRGIIQIGSSDTGHTMARSLNRLAMRLIYRVELSNLLCGLILAMTESIRQDTKITDLVSKLSSKWCDELEKRRTQLRASDIVEVFNGFYICTLSDHKIDINHPHILVVDNYLERVILQQGDVILDAARRLACPHMHLINMINKILQMMKERNLAPIMPGTIDPREPSQENIQSEIIVSVHNILRDPSNAARHMAELKRHANKKAAEYAKFVVEHPCGPLIDALKREYEETGGELVIQCPLVVERLRMMYDLSLIHLGGALTADDDQNTPPRSAALDLSKMDSTLVGTPLSRGGDATITRARGNQIRPRRQTNMTREKLADIKMQLERVKNGN
uniref:Cytoskeleton-associated protein 5 n=1 Tax=Caenorhabditis tropicalis TaxID=1561998 RepID=A0A1I7UF87_9PELO